MAKKKECNTISKEDQALFEHHVQGCTILRQNKVSLNPAPKYRPNIIQSADPDDIDQLFLLDDSTPHTPPVSGHERLSYHSPSISKKVLRNLGKGQYNVGATLDLHGLTKKEAKMALESFLNHCIAHHIRCFKLIHGKNSLSPAPVLKNFVHHWLRHLPSVLAFRSASNQDGGTGALLILLKSPSQRLLP